MSKTEKRQAMRRMLLTHDPHCWFCGRRLSEGTATIDHFVPQSQGGSDDPDNFRLACRTCNETKDNLPLERFVCPLPRGFGLIPLSLLEDPTMTTIAGFNYRSITDTKVRQRVRTQAKEIRSLAEKSAEMMIEIGQRLREVRDHLEDQTFSAWLEAELGWQRPQAYNYMQAAASFGDLDCLPQFDLTALVKLARKNVPEEAVAEAIDLAKSGEKVTAKRAVRIIDKHGTMPTATGRPRSQPDPQPEPEPKPAANPLETLQASLDAFTANLETMAQTIPPQDREALAERFVQLATQLRALPKAAAKPTRRKSTRSKSKAAA